MKIEEARRLLETAGYAVYLKERVADCYAEQMVGALELSSIFHPFSDFESSLRRMLTAQVAGVAAARATVFDSRDVPEAPAPMSGRIWRAQMRVVLPKEAAMPGRA